MLDQPEDIRRKIRKAVVSPRVVEDNGLLALVQYILLPAAGLKGKREFGICKQESTEPFMYEDIETVHEDYKNDVVSTDASYPSIAGDQCADMPFRSPPRPSRRPSARRSSSSRRRSARSTRRRPSGRTSRRRPTPRLRRPSRSSRKR